MNVVISEAKKDDGKDCTQVKSTQKIYFKVYEQLKISTMTLIDTGLYELVVPYKTQYKKMDSGSSRHGAD